MSKTIAYTTGVQGIADPSQVDGVTIRLAGTALATAPTLSLEDVAPFPTLATYLLGKVEGTRHCRDTRLWCRGFGRLFFAGHLDAGYPRLTRNTLD